MDVQLKRGLLDVCVLAAIRDEDSYGYRIIKDMKTVRTAEHNGRLRKYYRITEAGRARIEAFKAEWQEIMAIYRFVTERKGGREDEPICD